MLFYIASIVFVLTTLKFFDWRYLFDTFLLSPKTRECS